MSESKHNNTTNQEPTNQGTAQESNANTESNPILDKKTDDKSDKETVGKDVSIGKKSDAVDKKKNNQSGNKKNNVFNIFDKYRERVNKHEKYSINIYLDYLYRFDTKKRNTISEFRKKYEEDDKYDIAVLEEFTDNEKSVIIAFLDWCSDLPQHGIWFYKTIFWIKSRFGKKTRTVVSKKQLELKDLAKIDDYIQERVLPQLRFHDNKAAQAKRIYFRGQKWILGLSIFVSVGIAALTLLRFLIWDNPDDKIPSWYPEIGNVVAALCSAIVAFISSNEKLYSRMKEWVTNRQTCEKIKKEYALYQGKSEPYDIKDDEQSNGHPKSERLFRQNIERIIEGQQAVLDKYGKISSDEKTDTKKEKEKEKEKEQEQTTK